jgi:HEAT repeat protein
LSEEALPLLRGLRHGRASVRTRAARQIADLGLTHAAEALVEVAQDPNPAVRRAALAALLRLAPNRFAEVALDTARAKDRAAVLADLDALVMTELPLSVER